MNDDGARRSRLGPLDAASELPAPVMARDPDLGAALARLPDETREALALRYAAGLSAREIGEVLGRRPAAIQKLIERALATLKEDLHER